MPRETLHFRCPCCGQHAPVERLTEEGPFELALFEKSLGGKMKLSREDREDRKGSRYPRGSAPGALRYDEVPVTQAIRRAFNKRKQEI